MKYKSKKLKKETLTWMRQFCIFNQKHFCMQKILERGLCRMNMDWFKAFQMCTLSAYTIWKLQELPPIVSWRNVILSHNFSVYIKPKSRLAFLSKFEDENIYKVHFRTIKDKNILELGSPLMIQSVKASKVGKY